MLTRLKKNQVHLAPSPSSHHQKIRFDAHMNGMEETYVAIKHEWEEVLVSVHSMVTHFSVVSPHETQSRLWLVAG